MLHRARHLLVEQRTRLGNAIRSHLAEIRIVAVKSLPLRRQGAKPA